MSQTDNTLDKEIEQIVDKVSLRSSKGYTKVGLRKAIKSLIADREKKILKEMGENIMNATFIDGAKVFWNGKTYKIVEISQRAKEWRGRDNG